MSDLTSSALIGLIRRAFARRGLEEGGATVVVAAKAPAVDKRSLLEIGHARFGADAVLAVGREVLDISWDPVLAVIRRSASCADAVARWQRLERYYHSRHRTRVLDEQAGSLVLEHHATRGRPPALVEDLLIAGLVAGLLADAGARGLTASLDGGVCFLKNDRTVSLMSAPTSAARLHLRWRDFVAPHVQHSPDGGDGADVLPSLKALLTADPARPWRLEDAAARLQTSPRSLQRTLARSGESFRALVRRTRAAEAARLLAGSAGLAEIGFACGYADQAHFTREFGTCIGLPPGAYRSSLAGLDNARGAPGAA